MRGEESLIRGEELLIREKEPLSLVGESRRPRSLQSSRTKQDSSAKPGFLDVYYLAGHLPKARRI